MGAHLAAAALIVTAAVQPPSTDEIARQVHSTDARTVAWGAFHARAYHRVDLIPSLQRRPTLNTGSNPAHNLDFWSSQPAPRPVYYSRSVRTTVQYPVSTASVAGPSDEDRVEYLRAMSPQTGRIPFRAHTEVTVPWSTADALLERVRQLRSELEQRFRSLVEGARQSGHVPPNFLFQPRPIEVDVVDQRSDRGVLLPGIRR